LSGAQLVLPSTGQVIGHVLLWYAPHLKQIAFLPLAIADRVWGSWWS
jgi:hypothetical protein